MKFATALKGKRAERRCWFPYVGEDGATQEFACVAVPLTSEEEGSALAFAITYAKEKGVAEPKPGDPLYDLGYMATVVAQGLRDPDEGEPGKRPPTFTGGAKEILAELSRETLVYLYSVVEEWCDECSPSMRSLSDAAMFAAMKVLADKDGDKSARFLAGLGPSMRARLLLFMASRLWTLLEPKLLDGSSSETSSPTSPNSSSP